MRSTLAWLGVLLVHSKSAWGQGMVGYDICACAPGEYSLTLNFDGGCPGKVPSNAGIASIDCTITADASVTDLKPVSVQTIEIVTTNRNGTSVLTAASPGDYRNGTTITYGTSTSTTTATSGLKVGASQLPHSLQVTFTGENAAGQAVENMFNITFTNACDTYPVLTDGTQIGWQVFENLQPMESDYCPLSTGSTLPPITPTNPPTHQATYAPTAPVATTSVPTTPSPVASVTLPPYAGSVTVTATSSPAGSPTTQLTATATGSPAGSTTTTVSSPTGPSVTTPTVTSPPTPTSPVVGVDICACAPRAYTMAVDFAGTCPSTSISSSGIESVKCDITGGAGVTDFVPVSVQTVQIIETDQVGNSYPSTIAYGGLPSGTEVTYQMFADSDPTRMTASQIPKYMQFNVTAVNAANEAIANVFNITWTNACNAFPVISPGMKIGWVDFVSLLPPLSDYCPDGGVVITQSPTTSPGATSSPIAVTGFPTASPVLATNAPIGDSSVAGVDVCYCAPSDFKFGLDMASSCPTQVPSNGGIVSVKCTTTGSGPPVTITSATIIETDQNGKQLYTYLPEGTYTSGMNINFKSAVAKATTSLLAYQITKSLQVTLYGVNGGGDKIENMFNITYSNDCDVYPILSNGITLGWQYFNSLTPPPTQYCPAAAR